MSPGVDALLAWALVGAAGATFVVFMVALENFFVQPATLQRHQRLFQDLSVIVALAHGGGLLMIDARSDAWAGAGIAFYALALALFLASIEAARRVPLTRTFVYEPRPVRLIVEGPFHYVRHPIYISYSLAWVAAPVATWDPWLGALALLMIGCYVTSGVEEERRMLQGPLAEHYSAYMGRTAAVVPGLL